MAAPPPPVEGAAPPPGLDLSESLARAKQAALAEQARLRGEPLPAAALAPVGVRPAGPPPTAQRREEDADLMAGVARRQKLLELEERKRNIERLKAEQQALREARLEEQRKYREQMELVRQAAAGLHLQGAGPSGRAAGAAGGVGRPPAHAGAGKAVKFGGNHLVRADKVEDVMGMIPILPAGVKGPRGVATDTRLRKWQEQKSREAHEAISHLLELDPAAGGGETRDERARRKAAAKVELDFLRAEMRECLALQRAAMAENLQAERQSMVKVMEHERQLMQYRLKLLKQMAEKSLDIKQQRKAEHKERLESSAEELLTNLREMQAQMDSLAGMQRTPMPQQLAQIAASNAYLSASGSQVLAAGGPPAAAPPQSQPPPGGTGGGADSLERQTLANTLANAGKAAAAPPRRRPSVRKKALDDSMSYASTSFSSSLASLFSGLSDDSFATSIDQSLAGTSFGASSQFTSFGRSYMERSLANSGRSLVNARPQTPANFGGDARESEDADVVAYARYLGMDPAQDKAYLYIAKQALVAALPQGWDKHTDAEGYDFFHSPETGVSTYEHPMDEFYRSMFHRAKAIRSSATAFNISASFRG